MKKPNLIFKINRNNTAKIYVGGKWQKYVTAVDIHAEPMCHDIEIEQCKLNRKGFPFVENNEVARTSKKFHFGEVFNS